ncbi:MAG: hypothetical protein HY286_18620 [Planctomycetes bacterium]|nr:hypothetical protein [Planctomycetota bacterium]
MDKNPETPLARIVRRRLSPVKVAIRVLQDELDLSGDGRVVLDRTLVEDLIGSLEVFVDDLESDAGVTKTSVVTGNANGGLARPGLVTEKPAARMNQN